LRHLLSRHALGAIPPTHPLLPEEVIANSPLTYRSAKWHNRAHCSQNPMHRSSRCRWLVIRQSTHGSRKYRYSTTERVYRRRSEGNDSDKVPIL
jgi:hypothetical protein